MAVGIAVAQANGFLDAYCTTVFVKLHTGDPGAAGTSNAATETTRKAASFAAASAGVANTDADMAWTSVAGTETYSHVSLWDDVSAGNFLGSDSLDTQRAVTAGDNFTLAAGNVSVTLTPLAA